MFESGSRVVREWFKDDVVISNLCVGYHIPKKDVLCKKLICVNPPNGEEILLEPYTKISKEGNLKEE